MRTVADALVGEAAGRLGQSASQLATRKARWLSFESAFMAAKYMHWIVAYSDMWSARQCSTEVNILFPSGEEPADAPGDAAAGSQVAAGTTALILDRSGSMNDATLSRADGVYRSS